MKEIVLDTETTGLFKAAQDSSGARVVIPCLCLN